MFETAQSRYSANLHSHTFAAWAASRAASVKNCRFSVELGQAILAEWSFTRNYINFSEPDLTQLLPKVGYFDEVHLGWRREIIVLAAKYDLQFTHGIAAKLINIYLKALYLGYFRNSVERVNTIHPPIDSVLLQELCKQNFGGKARFWREANLKRWSKFSSQEYEEVINKIRKSLPHGQGLWTIEQFWQGYQ
jgi:hypothetical protein